MARPNRAFNLVTWVGYIVSLVSLVVFFKLGKSIEKDNLLFVGIIVCAFGWGIYRAYFAKPRCSHCGSAKVRLHRKDDSGWDSVRIFQCTDCKSKTSVQSLKNHN